MRNGVRALFRQIALVYPVSKLFSYVMEGLKSKNARQRTGRFSNSIQNVTKMIHFNYTHVGACRMPGSIRIAN